MEETIAELRRQLEEERKAREEAERLQGEAERRLQPNTLFRLLDRCHESLSQAIRVETDATLTTQGDATDPVNRLYPKRIVPWPDFPQLQEQVWSKFDRTAAFTSRPLFPSDTQVDYVATNIIESNSALDPKLMAKSFIVSQMSRSKFLHDTQTPQRPANTRHGRGRGRAKGAEQRQKPDGTARRRNRRADQFCVHTVADERQIPVYTVEFKAPHKVTIPEFVAGLHQMDLARDVINQEGDTFEFYATRLVAAVVTQIFSYMIDSGVRHGYICTGEAFVFLHIPKDDPTIVQFLADDELRLHRTAIGQVLAFTLQALIADAPSQE
ncbi:hypothetical protein N7509_003912 [Penicillium cosmopolitanum]|uniref:Uncharacterized protein n=1 Tax=Penicillium cosmopolitanum TaxID=1131564 RepID=A0A9W9W609_9EURO|nr:uncharacterized protein N7509_003912 [Penicillium cosmopolitanum]KAJ5404041.1 hypothetical protein N7509_003912 [Penicillium cosmopolitanum]